MFWSSHVGSLYLPLSCPARVARTSANASPILQALPAAHTPFPPLQHLNWRGLRTPRAPKLISHEIVNVEHDRLRLVPGAAFGHGLPYTDSTATLSSVSGQLSSSTSVSAEIAVRNRGQVSGRHVVQLYLEMRNGSRSLESFAKTKELATGLERSDFHLPGSAGLFQLGHRAVSLKGGSGQVPLDPG